MIKPELKISDSNVTAGLIIGIIVLLVLVATLAQNAVAKNTHRTEQIGRCAKLETYYVLRDNMWQEVITCNGWKPGQAPE